MDSRRIVLEEPIKALGVYQVPVKLTAGVTAEVKVWVVADRTQPVEVIETPAPEPVVQPMEEPVEEMTAEADADAEVAEAGEEETIEA